MDPSSSSLLLTPFGDDSDGLALLCAALPPELDCAEGAVGQLLSLWRSDRGEHKTPLYPRFSPHSALALPLSSVLPLRIPDVNPRCSPSSSLSPHHPPGERWGRFTLSLLARFAKHNAGAGAIDWAAQKEDVEGLLRTAVNTTLHKDHPSYSCKYSLPFTQQQLSLYLAGERRAGQRLRGA